MMSSDPRCTGLLDALDCVPSRPGLTRQLNRAEVLRLVRAATHEINTPLAVLQSAIENLRHTAAGLAGAELLNTLQREVMRLVALSEDLYWRVRLAADDLAIVIAEVDLGETLRWAARAVESEHPGRVIALRLEHPLPAVLADKGCLETMVWLLLNNAVRYSSAPEITLVVRWGAKADVEVVMVDEALSLSGEAAESIFEPLPDLPRTLGRPQLGLGLGLYVTRELARRLGGDVRIEPPPGDFGNCFVLSLRAARAGVAVKG